MDLRLVVVAVARLRSRWQPPTIPLRWYKRSASLRSPGWLRRGRVVSRRRVAALRRGECDSEPVGPRVRRTWHFLQSQESDRPPTMGSDGSRSVMRGGDAVEVRPERGNDHNGCNGCIRRSFGFAAVHSLRPKLLQRGGLVNSREPVRTPASACHAEGRGFESHHPLPESPRRQ